MNNEPKREETIFNAALNQQTPERRAAYVRQACGEDVSLRKRMEGLLRAHEAAGSFLDQPAAGIEVSSHIRCVPNQAAQIGKRRSGRELAGMARRPHPPARGH